MKRPSTRSLIVWPIIALIAGFAVYKFKFAPSPVIAHTVVRGEITPGLRGIDRISVTQGLVAGDQVLRLPDGQKSNLADGQRVKLP